MVSIIIPTYNASLYIERAINSVIKQTDKDWELIIVNDASTDNTLEVLKQYKNYNLKIINNERNVGVGQSRINGVDAAKGEYITFLDSDDYLQPNFIKVHLQLINEHNSDIAYTSFGLESIIGEYMEITVKDLLLEGEATINIHFWLDTKFLTGKLFKTELVKNTPLSNKRLGEDVSTLFNLLYNANKVRVFPYVGYMHVCREGSLLSYDSNQMTEMENVALQFRNFCYSSLAEIDMLEFLKTKNDMKVYKVMFDRHFPRITKTIEYIQTKVLPTDIYENNKDMWNIIEKYYMENSKIID